MNERPHALQVPRRHVRSVADRAGELAARTLLWLCCASTGLFGGCGSYSPAARRDCALADPPANAGEVADSGAKLIVYPRAKQMGSEYSGCQSVWIDVGNGQPKLIGRFHYADGRYVAYSASVGGRPEATICRYRNGKLVDGDTADCEAEEVKPLLSMAAGCFAAVRDEAMTGRPAAAACRVHE